MEETNLIDNTFANRLELWGFEKDVMIYSDCSLGCMLKLSPLDISCEKNESINHIKIQIVNFLNSLPEGLSVQFLQHVTTGQTDLLSKHKKLVKESSHLLYQQMTDERLEYFEELDAKGFIPKQELYMLVRSKLTQKLKSKSGIFSLGHKKKTPQEEFQEIIDHEILKFENKMNQICGSLESVGISSDRLKSIEIYKFLYSTLNPDRPIPAADLDSLQTDDVRDSLCLTDFSIGFDSFRVGKFLHKVISLKNIPELTFASMAENLKNLPIDSMLMLSIETTNTQKEIDTLKIQQKLTYSMVAGNRGVTDIESQAKLSEINDLMGQMVSGNEKIFKVAVQVVLRSDSLDVLEEYTSKTLQIFQELSGAEAMIETVGTFPIFCEIMPPHARAKERVRRLNSSVLADFLPVYGLWKGHTQPRVLLRNQEQGLIGFDPFSEKLGNFNQVISGGSGSGKSFLTSLIINQMGKESPKVIIIDIGGSYERTCKTLGGQYIPLGLNLGLSLNPFDRACDDPAEIDKKVKFLVSLVEIMTKEDDSRSLEKYERAELERALVDVIRDEPDPKLTNLMEKLVCHQDEKLKRIGKILGTWCGDSAFGKFLDQKTSISLEKNIVCFDLKGLEQTPDMQAVALFVITDLVWREVQRDKTSKKFVVFDECWRLLESPSASQFIAEVFRTFRKYQASAVAISQAISDFARSKVASAILPNSSVKWILRQTGGGVSELREELKLNEKEIGLIGNLRSIKGQYSEAFLICDEQRQVVRISATPLEYWLATTDPADMQTLKNLKEQNYELSDIEILQLASRKN